MKLDEDVRLLNVMELRRELARGRKRLRDELRVMGIQPPKSRRAAARKGNVTLLSKEALQQGVMAVRAAVRKELASTGNARCWINLCLPLPEWAGYRFTSMRFSSFHSNCANYHERNVSGFVHIGALVPGNNKVADITVPERTFLRNCANYHKRNQP